MVNNSFAKFFREIYSNPAAKDALQHFEKRHKWYSSIVILILWHIKNRLGRLTRSQLITLHHTIFAWHERIIKPLERLQKMMAKQNNEAELKKLSDETEQLLEFSIVYEINLLETHLPSFRHNKRPDKVLISDACQNILVYCKLIPCQLGRKDIKQINTLFCAIFEEFESNEIHNACKNHISAYRLKQPLSFEQMLLEEL